MQTTEIPRRKLAGDHWFEELKAVESFSLFQPSGQSLGMDLRMSEQAERPPVLSDLLKQVAGGKEQPAFVLELTALVILLYHYTGKEEQLVMVPGEEAANNVFIRVHTEAGITGRTVLNRVVAAHGIAHQYGEYELSEVLRRLEINGFDDPTTLFEMGFESDSRPLHGEGRSLLKWVLHTGNFEWQLDYSFGQYVDWQARQLLEHYRLVLEDLLKHPDAPLQDSKSLFRQHVFEEQAVLNHTDHVYEGEPLLHRMFEAQVKRSPDATAVVFGDREYSYQYINEEAARLAALLVSHDTPGSSPIVALNLERSGRMVIAMLGVMKAGKAYLPIGPDWPQAQRDYILGQSKPFAVITEVAHAGTFRTYPGRIFFMDDLPTANQKALNLPAGSGDDLAYVIYTSGTTGYPKGVMIRHRSIANTLHWRKRFYDFGPEHANLQVPSYAFDSSVEDIFSILVSGGKLVIPEEQHRVEAAYLKALIYKHGITHMLVVPSFYQNVLLEDLGDALAQIKVVTLAGEATTSALLRKHYECCPQVALVNEYGPSESAVCATAAPLERTMEKIPIGTPIDNVQVWLLNQHLEPVGNGVIGELFISGAGLMQGYLGMEEQDHRKLVDIDMGGINVRCYRTGDLGYRLPSGELYFTGRNDSMVKIRGNRIELGQVEHHLHAVDGVSEAVVRVCDDAQGQPQLVAYIVPSRPCDNDQVKSELQKKLPAFMVPNIILFMDRFPVNRNGKIDTKALPNPADDHSRAAYKAPVTELERMLALHWEQVLEVEHIGTDDNFFQLGGDSIKGIRLVNLIQEHLEQPVHLVTLFESPTIAEFAKRIEPEQQERKGIDEAALTAFVRQFEAVGEVDIPAEPNPMAAFILCPPRSGSTLLRIMLAGHSGLFAPPDLELAQYATMGQRKREVPSQYDFHLEGVIRAVMEVKRCSDEEARAFVAQREAQDQPVHAFYKELQEAIGPRMLVDKTVSYALHAGALERIQRSFEHPKFIHLIRHPKAMMHSFLEIRAKDVFAWSSDIQSTDLAEMAWLVAHRNITEFSATCAEGQFLQVFYEDLVQAPRQVVQRICDFLGITFEERMIEVYREQEGRMISGPKKESRMLGDPNFFMHGKITTAPVHQWRDEMPELETGFHTAGLAARFGYRMRERMVVRLREGVASESPVFLIHPVGGDVSCYGALAKSWPPGATVYGIRAHGLAAGEEPGELDVETLAATYLQLVEEVNPKGVSRFAGWSFGGLVAYEMTRQLEALGREVCPPLLIDTWMQARAVEETPAVADLFRNYLRERAVANEAAGAQIAAYLDGPDMEQLLEQAKAQNLVPREITAEEVLRHLHVSGAHMMAAGKYRPAKLKAPITLIRAFRSGESDFGEDGETWSRLSEGGLVRKVVHTDHYALMDTPGKWQLDRLIHALINDTHK